MEKFREIAKAVEVLEDEKTREDYDYYLSHPWVIQSYTIALIHKFCH